MPIFDRFPLYSHIFINDECTHGLGESTTSKKENGLWGSRVVPTASGPTDSMFMDYKTNAVSSTKTILMQKIQIVNSFDFPLSSQFRQYFFTQSMISTILKSRMASASVQRKVLCGGTTVK